MNFEKYIKQSGIPFWRVPKQRAKHALWLEKHKPKNNWTQSERQLVKKARESVEYWEMRYEEENQPNIKIGTANHKPESIEIDLITTEA